MRRIKDLLISALQDFSYAVRIAIKNPGAPLVLVIGFAIGAALFGLLILGSESGFVFLIDHANLLFHEAGHPAIGLFSTPEELQQQWEDCRRGIVPADPTIALQIPSAQDPDLAPPGKHAASAFALWFPVEADHALPAGSPEETFERVRRIIDSAAAFARPAAAP